MPALLDALRVDTVQALRRIRRTPWLSLGAIATLAVAIAANTTIFSLLKPTVLRKLPVPAPDALVGIGATDIRTNNYSAFYVEAFRALQSGQQSFEVLGAYSSSVVRVEYGSTALDTGVEGVTPEYFDALGARAGAGRVFSRHDDPLIAAAVITRRLESRLFGEGSALGQHIVADGRTVEIIGVFAGGFDGVRMDGGDDVFVMLPYLRSILAGSDPKDVGRAQQLIGRLAPGATLESARAEMLGRWPGIQHTVRTRLPAAHQATIDNQRVAVDSFARGFSGLRDRYGEALKLLMALAAALLLVGCVNLSGLMLARALTRQHEFAIRIAMGVSRGRLMQQLLIDGVLLSLASLIVALPMAWWASGVLTSMVSVSRAIPLGDTTTPDLPILLTAAGVSLAAGIVIGLLPARRALTRGMDQMLRGRGTSHRIGAAARALMVTQVAASMILVIGAGLFVTTLTNLYANNLVNHSHPILFTRLSRNPLERSTTLQQPYFESLQARMADVPGADAAAFSDMYPALLSFFAGIPGDTVTSDGVQASAIADYVSPGFFDLYSIALLRGRDFTWGDNATAAKVVIVNDTLAKKLSPTGDVIGRRLQIASGAVTSDVEVIGVVADANVGSIRDTELAGLYRPMMQDLRRAQTPMAHLRFAGTLRGDAHRGYVEAVNGLGQHRVRALLTVDGWIDNAVVEQRLIAGTASAAAMLALVLSSIGLFALVAYSVSSRVREIGVRMSLGATREEVMRMIVRESLAMVIPGIAAGVPLAIGIVSVVRSQLYGVAATDPWTIGAACAVFVTTTAIAAFVPARRASQIQPSEALRQD